MAGLLWVSDREPGIRGLFAELLPEAEVLAPDELKSRLGMGQRPDGLVIDGTQLLELPVSLRKSLLHLPRVLVCTGMLLASIPVNIVAGPNVAVMAKPFSVEDLESAIEWLRGAPRALPPISSRAAALVQRRRPRRARHGLAHG